MINRVYQIFVASACAGALVLTGCADPTSLESERTQRAEELSNHLAAIQAADGASLIISAKGKVILSITQAGHPLRGVSYELPAEALPDFDPVNKEVLVLRLTSEPLPELFEGDDSRPGQLDSLRDQSLVGPVVGIGLKKFPGGEDVTLVGGGTLVLPLQPCVPALLQDFVGAVDLTGDVTVVEDTIVRFKSRQVIAPETIEGVYAPTLGGEKECGGLQTSQPPIAGGLLFHVDEDEVLEAELSIVDNNPDEVIYSMVTSTNNGELVLNDDGSFTYTPEPDFYGEDRFEFQGFDGYEISNVGVANIFVKNVNDAPVAEDVVTTTTLAAGNVVGELVASDIDHSVLALKYRVEINASYGSILLKPCNGANCPAGRAQFTYTITGDICGAGGEQDTFTYIASDLVDDSAPATVTINITDCP